MTPLEVIEYNGLTIEIHHDDLSDHGDPLDNYDGGKTISYQSFMRDSHTERFKNPQEVLDHAQKTGGLVFPVRGYSHSGRGWAVYGTVRAGQYPFTCPWDSGFAGMVLFEKAYLQEHFPGMQRLSKARVNKMREVAVSWMAEYEAWANGDGYGYIVKDADGEEVDSLWGFIGEMADCITEAKQSADCFEKSAA